METERMDVFNIFGAFFAGGILGAVTGLLLAPRSGKETRDEIWKATEKTLEETRQFYAEARAKADAVLEDTRRKADELRRDAEREFQEAWRRAGKIMSGGRERSEKGPGNPIYIESPEEIMGGVA